MTIASDISVPWYRTLDRRHWKALLATNLGWMFDGYETFALILTLGVPLPPRRRPGRDARLFTLPADPRLCRNGARHHAVRLGRGRHARRHPRRLHRPQAHDDHRHPGLFAVHRTERLCVELVFLRGAALS